MPKLTTGNDESPEKLKPFESHGLDFDYRTGDKEATTDCPFCGKEGKFTVAIEEGTWRCFSCNTGSKTGKARQGGNIYTFIRLLWEE